MKCGYCRGETLGPCKCESHEKGMTCGEKIQKLQEALEAAGAMQRELEQALCSPFPGEDAAIAQLQQGTSIIERSMVMRIKEHKKLIEETKK